MRFPTVKIVLGAIALAAASLSPTLAQDAQGNDTPGEWIVDYFETYGIWVSSCDHRVLEGKREDRCYLRYVDVYSPRPKFGAAFVFVFQKDRKTAFQYANERGTEFAARGLGISRNGSRAYVLPEPCRDNANCFVTDESQLSTLLDEMSKGGTFVQTFTSKHGDPHQLKWPLDGFADALADYRARSAKLKLVDE